MIELKNITKKYGEKTVYSGFDLCIEEGKVTAVLGESGSGKTTLLNILASLTDYSGTVSGLERGAPVSYVFQSDRLVPNLTVQQNLMLTCGGKNADTAEISAALEKAGLGGYEKAYPSALSAGMKRRVALLRAFLFDSPVILMDEPFINLDPALKYSLMDMFSEFCKATKRTAVFVTHDVKEACYLADRIIIISNGKIIYDKPNRGQEGEKELLEIMLKTGRKM